jgi:hypothetical protein
MSSQNVSIQNAWRMACFWAIDSGWQNRTIEESTENAGRRFLIPVFNATPGISGPFLATGDCASKAKTTAPGSGRDFEAALWATADKLRGTLDAAEYKHVVLGLIFLKYISDAFEERRADLDRLSRDKESDLYVKNDEQRQRLLEDKDEYAAVNVFSVRLTTRSTSTGG